MDYNHSLLLHKQSLINQVNITNKLICLKCAKTNFKNINYLIQHFNYCFNEEYASMQCIQCNTKHFSEHALIKHMQYCNRNINEFK